MRKQQRTLYHSIHSTRVGFTTVEGYHSKKIHDFFLKAAAWTAAERSGAASRQTIIKELRIPVERYMKHGRRLTSRSTLIRIRHYPAFFGLDLVHIPFEADADIEVADHTAIVDRIVNVRYVGLHDKA